MGPDATVAEVRAASQTSGHLRILVRDGDGGLAHVVHVRDTMRSHAADPARALARPVFRVGARTPVYELLRQMREQRQQLAVVDHETGVTGIVTVTDVVRRVLPGSRHGRPILKGPATSSLRG